MNVKITSDSTIDMPPEMLEQYGISIIYVPVVMGDTEYTDNITPQDIYDYAKRTGKIPKTAARNSDNYVEFFTEKLEGHDALVHISMSSGISASCSCAQTAAQQFDGKVRVIDGLSLSTGTALLALRLIDSLEAGATLDDAIADIEAVKNKLQVSFVIDSMDFLFKNGRCSALSAFIASKLLIKPTIIMNAKGDGRMTAGKKHLARFEKAIAKYADDIMDNNPDPNLRRCFITYTHGTPANIVESVKQRVSARFAFEEIILTTAGNTITCHCGRSTLGILYLNN